VASHPTDRARSRGRPALDDPTPTDGEVLDAALEAFAERGFAETSVREVAPLFE